jgi:hypothetical protein
MGLFWARNNVGCSFGFGLWRLHTMPGQRLHLLYFIGYFQLISLDSQQNLATQSHGLLTWTAIMWSDPKSLLACYVSEPLLKARWNFGISSFHLSNFEITLGSKIGYAHGTAILNSQISLQKATLAHLEGQARTLVFNRPTLIFMYA